MKRILLVLSAALLIVLSACGASDRTVSADYSGPIQATDGQLNYLAALDSKNGDLTLTYSSPDAVAGIATRFQNGELHTSLNGLDCITSADSLPASSVPALLYDALSDTSKAEYRSTEDGVDHFTIPTRGTDAAITAKDGKLLTLSRGSITIYFTKNRRS